MSTVNNNEIKTNTLKDSTGVTNITLSPTGRPVIAGVLGSGLVSSVTTSYVITDTDSFKYILVGGSGSRTITLPAAANNIGRPIYIEKTDTSNAAADDVTVARTGADAINGTAANRTLSIPNEVMGFVAEASGSWRIITEAHRERYQTKTLGSDETTTGDKSGLGFSNLVVGRTYQISGFLGFDISAAGNNASVTCQIRDASGGGGNAITESDFRISIAGGFSVYQSNQHITPTLFVASTTSLFFRVSTIGANNRVRTFSTLTLRELRNVSTTTIWT